MDNVKSLAHAQSPIGKAHGKFLVALEEILKASIDITDADYGNVQMVNAEGDALEIVAQRGFDKTFLDHFKRVPLKHASAVCGRAAEAGGRVMIKDVETDPAFKEHLEIARSVPFRAVQSTPLFNRNGTLLGMLSTHFKRPRLPDEKYLHMLDLYALQASHTIELIREKTAPTDSLSTAVPMQPNAPLPALVTDAKLSLQTLDVLPFFADLTSKEKTELLQASRFRHFQCGA